MALVVLTGLLIFFFISYTRTINTSEKDVKYDKYYVMITDDSESSFWQSVYEQAYSFGKEQGAYVEMLSSNLSKDYSAKDLLEIATFSGVDGIIVEADESEETRDLINKAVSAGIPVVTLLSDSSNSERLSFIGVGNYYLGREYGNQIIKMAKEKLFSGNRIKVVILVDANSEDSGKNVLSAAIQETVENEDSDSKSRHKPIDVSFFSLDTTNSFSVEESVRHLFISETSSLPSIIVCLSEIATTSTYQAVVDYNTVGLVNILGYYDSDSILKGIERGVIYSTISTDTAQLGQFCIDAFSEYYEFGNTSQYFLADITVIDSENVAKYMKGEGYEE